MPTTPYMGAEMRRKMARGMAAEDPSAAERQARTNGNPYRQAEARVEMAKAQAALDPAAAERLARTPSTSTTRRPRHMVEIAKVLIEQRTR